MGISSLRTVEYFIKCDKCGCCNNCVNIHENIHNKQQAIKRLGFHKIKDGSILCECCFKNNTITNENNFNKETNL